MNRIALPAAACRRTLAVSLATMVVLAGACGGSDASRPPAETGAGSSLGRAEATLPATTAADTTRPAGESQTAAATPRSTAPAAGAGSATSPGRGAAAVATPHPDTPDPCGLVTLAEAEAALGGRPIPGRARRSSDSAEVRCTYDFLSGGRTAVVSVWKGSEARPVYELRRSAYGEGATIEDVRGLGDRAFVVKGDEGWVNVLKGDVYVSVQIANQTPTAEQGLNGQELRNRAMTLARTAVGRL